MDQKNQRTLTIDGHAGVYGGIFIVGQPTEMPRVYEVLAWEVSGELLDLRPWLTPEDYDMRDGGDVLRVFFKEESAARRMLARILGRPKPEDKRVYGDDLRKPGTWRARSKLLDKKGAATGDPDDLEDGCRIWDRMAWHGGGFGGRLVPQDGRENRRLSSWKPATPDPRARRVEDHQETVKAAPKKIPASAWTVGDYMNRV